MFDIDKLNRELYKKSIFNTECGLVKHITTEEWSCVVFSVTSCVGDFNITTRTHSDFSLVNITVDIGDGLTNEYNIVSDIFDVYGFMVNLCMMTPIIGRYTRKEVIPDSTDLDRDRIVLTRENISTITVDVSETTISVQYESRVDNTDSNYPILFNHIYGVVEGVHRVHRAKHNGLTRIPVKVLAPMPEPDFIFDNVEEWNKAISK